MEAQCDYFMYFPAVPFPARELLRGEPGRYRALPRRNHLYLGETVRFLLVLRGRPGPGGARTPWGELGSSLAALASVSPGAVDPGGEGDGEPPEEPGGDGDTAPPAPGFFRDCRPLLTHGQGPLGRPAAGIPVEEPIVCTDEVIFPLTISLDNLPPGTVKAKIVVTVWKREQEAPEVRERGYLSLLQNRAPAQLFREEQGAFKAQVSTMLTVLPPPGLRCRQLNVSGKYLTVLKVLNGCSQEEISLWDVRILPNFNASYLPMLPDGSVLLVDDVCHHSGEVPVGAFCRVAGAGSGCPCALSALEEQNFLFQLQAPERPQEDTKEGLEVPLVAVVQWSTPKLPFTSSIYTHYREEAVQRGAPGHAGSPGRHRLPHSSQQPGLLPQGQRPDHPGRLPGPPRRPLRALPAHEAEAAVHGERLEPTPRRPAHLAQEQPWQPGCAGPGRAAPGWAGPVPVLLPPAAFPQPPHEVW
ncbi:trafficking protein particle complex subunit 14 isoform X2 [Chelonia mydas]|uniref:trafficking protein particle complex subunit 14 isoform X2 n=1 Tax=Chelonia mydas TaxID=8469 RepID=UPI0018A1C533|nr:trafficking protein particle complex subunit 14 isoform X2 [Chelonia mydas]